MVKAGVIQASIGRSAQGVVESAFRTMRLAAKQAADKIVKHLDCADEKVSLRAAEDVIEFAKEFISLEEHERRIRELEEPRAGASRLGSEKIGIWGSSESVTMDSQERRIRNLEKAIPKKTANFNASFENLNDAPIDEDDLRLIIKSGVEEFQEFLPGNGRYEKRGRAYLNRWTIVKFWGGGKRKSWNQALHLLRADPDMIDGRHGFGGSVSFSGEDGEVVRSGGFLILFGRFDRPGWRTDKRNDSAPSSFTFNIGDD